MSTEPAPETLAAFGVRGPVSKLDGGRGGSWRAGSLAFKPQDTALEELQWLHRVARPRGAAGRIRVSLPVPSESGLLVVNGWTASPYLRGTHEPNRWVEIADAAREFAAVFAGVERPAFIDSRTDAWARADRFAWGDGDASVVNGAPHVAALAAARRPIDEPHGLIHGDLTGNVLFDPVELPAVIDLSLYWRPTNFAIAIVAVDAVCFQGAPLALLETISPHNRFPQHLVRALLYRIATDRFHDRPEASFGAYSHVVARVLRLAGR